jgi:transcription antitermination factor NusG
MNENTNKWYVLRVQSRHEKAVAERLSQKYEVFLPLYKKKSQWSDRVKIIDTPLFPGYLFIKTEISNKYFILETQGVGSFVEFGKFPAVIHENEIEAIKIMLENPQSIRIDDTYSFNEGEKVKVIKGVFNGVTGRIQKLKNKLRIFVQIEQLGKILSVEVDKDVLEKLPD